MLSISVKAAVIIAGMQWSCQLKSIYCTLKVYTQHPLQQITTLSVRDYKLIKETEIQTI